MTTFCAEMVLGNRDGAGAVCDRSSMQRHWGFLEGTTMV